MAHSKRRKMVPAVESNPYAPPQTVVADVPEDTGEAGEPAFFPVSRTKLIVLTFCTLGIYEYYWLYKNWKLVRNRTGERIMPFWRAFFAVFFCYSLFDRVRKYRPDLPASQIAAGPLAIAWIVLTVLHKLPDPYWLVTFGAAFVLLPVQSAIDAINRDVAPGHDPNARFTAWNWVAVILGGPFFLFAVYATFYLPD